MRQIERGSMRVVKNPFGVSFFENSNVSTTLSDGQLAHLGGTFKQNFAFPLTISNRYFPVQVLFPT